VKTIALLKPASDEEARLLEQLDVKRLSRRIELGAGHPATCYGFTCAVTRAIEAL
jgi:hypothetical protein